MRSVFSSAHDWTPRLMPMIAALIGLGWALHYVVMNETPVGGIEGHVYLTDSHQRLSGVQITLRSENDTPDMTGVRHAVSDAHGRFALINVPAGDYSVLASTHAHRVREAKIHVDEGRVTPLSLGLERSLPDFRVIAHQRIFGTQEQAHLSVAGYVDSAKRAHHDGFHLRIYRVRLSHVLKDSAAANALEEVGRGYDPAPSLPDALLKPTDGSGPENLRSEEIRLRDEDREGFFYHRIGLGRLHTGLYLIDLAHGKDTGCTWLLVTDTALVLKRAGKQLVAFTVDMQSGKPVAGSAIRTYHSGRLIANGVTDARGLTEYSLPTPAEGDEGDHAPVTVAIRGEDEAVVSRDGTAREENGSFAVHTYTDRPLYRPGQRIYFKSIVRRIVPQHHESALQTLATVSRSPNACYAVPAGVTVEAELLDPKGDVALKRSYRTNRFGSMNGSVDLLDEAVTGVYTLKLRVAGEEHTHEVSVASYHKPEFAVTVRPDKKRYTSGEQVAMTIDAQYYFGAPVAGAKVTYNVYSAPDWAAEYPDDYDYNDDDSAPAYFHYRGDSYFGGSVTDGTVTLDAAGKAVVHFRASSSPDGEGPQDMVYTCHVTVTADQDREAEAEGEARVGAGDFRLTVDPSGYLAMPGHPMEIVVAARDPDGLPVAGVPVALELSYQSWSENGYRVTKAGVMRTTTGLDGRAQIPVTPPRTGDLQLMARASDREGHTITGSAWIWVADDAGGDLDTSYNDLSLMTDRRSYQPGDMARVLINADRTGETLLLSVEGDRVQSTQTMTIRQHSTVVRVPMLAQYGPNVFVSACYVKNKHFAQSSVPLRVSLPGSELHLNVSADRKPEGANPDRDRDPDKSLPEYGPGEKITYHVQATDEKGQPAQCEFSLGVADEAIYALQEDDPSALRNDFYPHRYNAVNTIYSFAAEYLGDADKAEPKIVARKRFPDTAYWQPDLQTDARGQATVTFQLPDNLTTWRATVTGHTLDTRVGRAVEKVMVTKPFLVRVETPRTLTQGDHTDIVAFIHNQTGQAQSADVRLRAEGLTATGAPVQSVSIAPGAVGEVHWPATAGGYGTARLTVSAWTHPENGRQYTDGLETMLPVRPYGREEDTTYAGELTASAPETEVVRLDPAVAPGTGRLTVRITPNIASALTGGLNYLTGFPYGCVEQTMSRMLPDMLVRKALQRRAVGQFPNAEKLPTMVADSLQRLYRFQHESGAWGWWEHDEDDVWMTSYVLYGLAIARAEGYPVSERALTGGIKAGKAMMHKCRAQDLPFLLYALTLNGVRDTVRAARQRVQLTGMSPEALAYLALTDRLLGPGRTAMDALNHRAVVEDSLIYWRGEREFDDDRRSATAAALRAMIAYDPQDARIEPAIRWLMLQRTGDYWEDTRDTSMVLAAFCDYLRRQTGYSGGGSVQVRLNGQVAQTYTLAPDEIDARDLVLHLPATALRPGKNAVTLARTGGTSPIYYTVELRQTVAMESFPPLTVAGLKVKREYLRVSTQKSNGDAWRLNEEPTDNRLNMGDHVRVRLTITAPRDMSYVLIEDPFPAGCEVNERGDADEITDWSYWWSSVDVRDDRIAFFARSLARGTHVIEYNLRAQTPGSYHALPTLVQAMYAPEQRCETAEDAVDVH